jgi:hypothetical protein
MGQHGPQLKRALIVERAMTKSAEERFEEWLENYDQVLFEFYQNDWIYDCSLGQLKDAYLAGCANQSQAIQQAVWETADRCMAIALKRKNSKESLDHRLGAGHVANDIESEFMKDKT